MDGLPGGRLALQPTGLGDERRDHGGDPDRPRRAHRAPRRAARPRRDLDDRRDELRRRPRCPACRAARCARRRPCCSSALDNQSDLALELQTPSVEVFSNSLFHGIFAATNPGSTALHAGLLHDGRSLGPADAGLRRSWRGSPRRAPSPSTSNGGRPRAPPTTAGRPSTRWRPSTTARPGTIVLHRFPLNGLLALFTLGMWGIVWLGFGWIHRLEWLFTGRRRVVRARTARRAVRARPRCCWRCSSCSSATGVGDDAAPPEEPLDAAERVGGVDQRRVDRALLHRPALQPAADPEAVTFYNTAGAPRALARERRLEPGHHVDAARSSSRPTQSRSIAPSVLLHGVRATTSASRCRSAAAGWSARSSPARRRRRALRQRRRDPLVRHGLRHARRFERVLEPLQPDGDLGRLQRVDLQRGGHRRARVLPGRRGARRTPSARSTSAPRS